MAQASTGEPVNLTKTAEMLRNLIKVGALFLVILMVGRVLLSSFSAYWQRVNPPPPPPPTMGFGYLTRIDFPESDERPQEYRLETVSGTTPYIADRANVYRMIPSQASFSAADRARTRASVLGFVFEPEILSENRYRWTFANPILSTLEMQIFNGTFTIKSNWSAYPQLLDATRQLSQSTAVSKVQSLLQRADLLYPEFSEGVIVPSYVKATGGTLAPAESLSDADFLEVNIYRSLIDEKYGSVTQWADQAPIHAVVASDDTIISMRFSALPVDFSRVETYPLRSTQEAWQELISGGGFVVESGDNPTATIRSVTLAYYEPSEETPFYQPVYVFRGDGGFVAYTSAIVPQLYTPNAQ